jgi:hypothetical protein
MCELRFATKNERDWHLRNEHEHLHIHPPADRPTTWRRRLDPDEQQRDPQDRYPQDEASTTEVHGHPAWRGRVRSRLARHRSGA